MKGASYAEMDTRMALSLSGKKAKADAIQKNRDVLKYVCMEDTEGKAYLVIGLENESKVSQVMPARNML